MEENLKQSIKYIVYLTVCKVNKKIYVGVHEITSVKFDGYLGDGVKISKPSSYKQRKELFPRAVNKYGVDNFIRITLFTYNTREEALKKESEIVNEDFVKREDTYNMTIGGEMPPIKRTKIYQYSLTGEFIKEWNSIKDASVSLKASIAGVVQSIKKGHQNHGYLWSYEKRDKISPYADKNVKPRKVAVYDKNGNFVKEYESIQACKKDYCGCVHVLYGQRKHCKHCTFKFID